MLARLSLRARLLLGVVLRSLLGLLAADIATYVSLRSFLVSRTDSNSKRRIRRSRPRSSGTRAG